MKELKNYIFHLKGFFSPEFCQKIINHSNNQEWKSHTWQTQNINLLKLYDHRELEVCDLLNVEASLRNEMFFRSMIAIDEYQMINQINVGVSYINDFRVNRYKKNSVMRKHVDHIHDLFDGKRKGIPILSIIINLNEDYTGGSLNFFDDIEYNLKTGDVILFPSNFLYPHFVSPVISGTRYSMVSWGY